jgi:glycosyltransferase involved in cell wall biosynthesis
MTHQNRPNIVVCIPAFNEEGRIGKVIEVAMKFATRVIVFDDGSTDKTTEISRNNGATVIRGEINKGYGNAIRGLWNFAKENDVDIMVTIDSDGQHDPYQIPSIIRPLLNKECDIVIGSRFIREYDSDKIPRYRKFGIKTITKAIQIASYNSITDAQSGFRAYNKLALSKLRLYDKGMSVSTEILLQARDEGLKIIEVPVTVGYDSKNLSTQHPLFHGLSVLSSVIKFITYSRPLLFYILPGFALFVVAAVFANQVQQLFIRSGYISTNLILVSMGTSLIGFICVSTGAVIYTLKALTSKKKNSIHSSRSSAIKFIAYRHPLLFYIIPGVVLFVVAAIFANQAREIYIQSLVHNTTYVYPTNLILVSIGAALIGSICLSTGAVIYTIMNLFRSKIEDV